jgi:hypothetical protein
MFCNWADAEHAGKAGRILGKHKFNDRVRLAGVAEFKPPSGSWCWDLIEVDPETADDGGSKLPTAPDCEQVPVQKSDVIDQSASSKPNLPTKTADSEIAVMVGALPMPMGVVTAVSAVLPYCTNPDRKPQLNSKQPQWVKTAEIAEDFLPALAVDPSLWSTPAEPLLLAGSTDPLVVDLETCSADQLWNTQDSTRPFVRLVGTDHGINTSPSQLLEHTGLLVAHNGFGFDFLALAHHHGLDLLGLSEQGRLVDTMVLETLAHPNRDDLKPEQYIRQLGLDASAERRGLPGKTDDLGKLAIEAAKAAGLSGPLSELKTVGFGLIPQGDPRYVLYLRGDVAAGRAVFDAQCPDGQLSPYQHREMRLMGRLAHGITYVGFRIDRPEVEAREAAKQQRVADGVANLRSIGLPERQQKKDGSWSSPHASAAGKAAIAKAFADLGVTLPLTPSGKAPSIKAELMHQLAVEKKDDPAVVALCETVAVLVGARSSMGNLLKHATGDRVHPQVFPGQATGRCSITNPGLTVFGKRGANAAEREVFLAENAAVRQRASAASGQASKQDARRTSAPARFDVVLPSLDIDSAGIFSTPVALPLMKLGKVRVLSANGRSRSALMPDVPTVAESGLPGFEMIAWTAVFLPAGTPEPIVLKLNKAIGEILRSAEFKQKAGPATDLSPGTPQQLDAFVRSEIDKWKRVVAQAKLEVE